MLKFRDEDRSLDLYLREIGETPLINAAEEVRLAKKIKHDRYLETLYNHIKPFYESIRVNVQLYSKKYLVSDLK